MVSKDVRVVTRLKRDAPHPPPLEALAADQLRHRFLVAFDSKACPRDFFGRMKAKRVGILSYHKHPDRPRAR